MRINIYGEELTYQSEIVHKVVDERNFYGVRMFLESSPFLHATKKDDDRSAVTFWVPWDQDHGNSFETLCKVLQGLLDRAIEVSASGQGR